jgi:hypothetical protein
MSSVRRLKMTTIDIIIVCGAAAIVGVILYIGERKREKNRNPYEETVINAFLNSPESIFINGEPLKEEDVYYLPRPENIPVGLHDDVEVVKINKKKRYSHLGLFNHALQSGKKLILSEHYTDGLKYDEILKMKKAIKGTGVYWINVSDDFEAALKSDGIIFKDTDGIIKTVKNRRHMGSLLRQFGNKGDYPEYK